MMEVEFKIVKIIYDGLSKLKGAKSVMICHCEDLTLVNEGVIRESDYANCIIIDQLTLK